MLERSFIQRVREYEKVRPVLNAESGDGLPTFLTRDLNECAVTDIGQM